MTQQHAPHHELQLVFERLVERLRAGEARIERRTVQRVGITDPTNDEPAIFITIETNGDVVGPNYVTDGTDEQQLASAEEDDIAELLAHSE